LVEHIKECLGFDYTADPSTINDEPLRGWL
jgi:hypothetical protein